MNGVCDYAACGKPAPEIADGWEFCTNHLHEHLADLADSEKDQQDFGTAESRAQEAAYRRQQVERLSGRGWPDHKIADYIGTSRSHVGALRRELGLDPSAPKRVAQCGTRSGFARHRDRREDPCDACRQADREYHAARKRTKRAELREAS